MFKRFSILPALIALVMSSFVAISASAQTGSSNLVQSGIVAAISGTVRITSNDIGMLPETGQKIYLNDIIETGQGGKLQILLLDRTTITIGPNSSVVIDEFVFDPGETRSLEATILKGAFKLASSSMKLKNPEKRTLNLPNAVVSIRGTELIGSIQDQVQNVVLLDGAITVANDGFTQDIDRPNFGVSINLAGEISPPSFVTSEDLGQLLEQIEGDGAADQDTSDAPTEEAAGEEAGTEDTETQDTENQEAESQGEDAQPLQAESSQDTAAPANVLEEGEAPSETEVVSAAEALASGTADVEDLQVLSRADPENISTVATILGLEVDEATGEVKPSEDSPFIANIENLLSAETDLNSEGLIEDFELELIGPDGDGLTRESFAERLSSFATLDQGALDDSGDIEFNSSFSSGFETGDTVPEAVFIERPIFEAPIVKIDDTSLNSLFEFASYDRDRGFSSFSFTPRTFSFSRFEESSFDGPGLEEANLEEGAFEAESFEDGGLSISAGERETTDQDITLVPLISDTKSEPTIISIEVTEPEAEPVLSFYSRESVIDDTPIFQEPEVTIDDVVTDALENVIETIAFDTLPIPENTFMPESNTYRSWSSYDWYTIARNFNSGTIRYEHMNETASFHSGSYCTSCSATVSSVLTIDFRAMEYQFNGEGVFHKPGYEPVTFTETTPEIQLGRWELSSGTISTLPNARELESTYDNPTVHTLTSSADPSVTVDATIDLDFIYDAQLSNNRDLTSNLGVFGLQEVEYTETGSSEVVFKTEEEAMTPVE